MGKNGITPFHMACYKGHLDIVTFLAVHQSFSPVEASTRIMSSLKQGRNSP